MTIAEEVKSRVGAIASRFARRKLQKQMRSAEAPVQAPVARNVPVAQQGALEGPPFGDWNKRGPIKTTAKNLGRLIYLINIPLRMQLPPRTDNLRELCFRTYPRASKLEIKRVLQLVYGMDVDRVHTLNMDGKKKFNYKKKYFYRTASYKKCYVYLKRPITLSKDLFPLNMFFGDKTKEGEEKKSAPSEETNNLEEQEVSPIIP